MMAAALFGAMTLGACVDNQESQSVTDIRDAKTEELKSQAALNNAAAEATKIMANAEAALKNAQAEVEKATAKQIEAQTALLEVEAELAAVKVELKEAELEAKVAELEALKAEYEQRITEAQAAIAKAEAQLEIDLAKAEYDLLVAQKDVITAAKNLESAQKIHYISLYNTYSAAVKTLNSARAELILANKEYVDTEEELIGAKQSALNTIEYYNQAIAEYEDNIAYLEAKKVLFEEYVTLTDAELEAKTDELEAEFDPAYTNLTLATLAYNRYCEANPEPEFPEAVEEYMLKMYAFINYPESTPMNYGSKYWDPAAGINMPEIYYNSEVNALGYDVVADHTCESKFVALVEFTLGQFDYDANDTLPYTEGSAQHENGECYTTYAPSKAWTINEENFEAHLKEWAKKLEKNNYTEAIETLKKTLKETVEAAEAEDGVYARHAAALEAYNKVPEVQAAAKKAAEDTKAAYEAAVKAKETGRADADALHKKTSALNNEKNALYAAWQKALQELAKDDKNETLVAAAAEAFAKYDAANKAYTEAANAWQAAEKALANADETIAEAKAAADEAAAAATEQALAKIATDAKDALDAVCAEKERTENTIARLEAQIAAGGYNPDAIANYETAVAWYESLKECAAIAADEKTYEELNAYWPAHFESEEYIAYAEASEAIWAIQAAIDALEDAYAADDDYEYYVNFYAEQIKQNNDNIESANAAIEALEAAIEVGELTGELALEEAQKVIDMLELKVAAAQKEVDEAKAKLDAALAE